MSSPQDSETKRAALEKALEGWRLLSSGDYEGAVAACTEAIELEPGSLGSYRTRAEAYRRLGRGKEAEADLKILGDRLGNETTLDNGDPRTTSEAQVWRPVESEADPQRKLHDERVGQRVDYPGSDSDA